MFGSGNGFADHVPWLGSPLAAHLPACGSAVGHVWMAPGWQGFCSRLGSGGHLRSCVRPVGAAAWPQALMGAVDRGLIKPAGSCAPMTRERSLSIRRSTDAAITRRHPRKRSDPAGSGRSRRRRPGPEVLLAHHHRPGDARHLVGQRAGRHLARLGREQSAQPGVLPGAPAAQHRHRAIHQQPAQLAVAALADRTEPDLAAGFPLRADHRGRPWDLGKPGAAPDRARRRSPGRCDRPRDRPRSPPWRSPGSARSRES